MNPAIWKKAVYDAWTQLWISAIILLLFSWLFVWLMSRFEVGALALILSLVPPFVERMMEVPMKEMATPVGQISIIYVHVVTLLVCVGWAVGRGSDSISGEIARGTMDLLLSLPIWRVTVMIVPALMAAIGAAILVASVWLGIFVGLQTVDVHGEVAPLQFIAGSVNLFWMVFCLTGITTFISSFRNDRWQTISIATAFFIVSLIVKMVARLWPPGEWLRFLSFLTAFQPQWLILMPDESGRLALQYNAVFLVLGLLAYAVAGIILWYRDIPSAI